MFGAARAICDNTCCFLEMTEKTMQYPINEMFETLQGEGYFTGVPAIFVRLQGCPVGCSWCDTKHTWDKIADREVDVQRILVKTEESDTWGNATAEQLLQIIGQQGYTARHVVITGGEPCIYDLTELTSLLDRKSTRLNSSHLGISY